MRKHWKSCTIRHLLGEAIPAQQPPGRRRRACDNCASLRQACDLNSPCGTCLERSQPCSYRLAADSNSAVNGKEDFFGLASWDFQFPIPNGQEIFTAELLGQDSRQPLLLGSGQQTSGIINEPLKNMTSHVQLEFLVQLTTCSGIGNIFNYATTSECALNVLESNSTYTPLAWELPPVSHASVTSDSGTSYSSAIEASQIASWISHPLFQHSGSIWDFIRQGTSFEAFASVAQDPQSMSDYSHIEFFNPVNLEKFLQLFWNCYSFNCPIIHKPSFDLKKTPTVLIFVLVLYGSFMSNNPEDSLNARKWLDLAESATFQRLTAGAEARGPHKDDSEDLFREKFKVLQGAFLVCVLQHWEGHDVARKRIRNQQFSAVVVVGSQWKLARNWKSCLQTTKGCKRSRSCPGKPH